LANSNPRLAGTGWPSKTKENRPPRRIPKEIFDN